jgi:stringent starvation protein B
MSLETSQKPYFIRALWEWCNDQGLTPQILVNIDHNTRVPAGFDDDGKIVLDISMDATQGLEMSNEWVSFQARFGTVAQQLDIPVARIAAIFAAETGQGMGFEVTDSDVNASTVSELSTDNREPELSDDKPKGSPLKLVK